MSFENSFLHTLSSQSIPETSQSFHDFLPPEIPYSTQTADYLIYLKAAGRFCLPSGTRYTQKNFHCYLLLYIEAGNATLHCNDESYALAPGNLCFLDCRNEYSIHCSTNLDSLSLFFDGYPVAYYHDIFSQSATPIIEVPNPLFFSRTFSHLIAQDFHHRELMNAQRLTELLTQIICLCHETASETRLPSWLTQLRKHLDENYQKKFSLNELADYYHINKYQICRDFKKHYNTTPLQYLNYIRIEQAKSLLQNTNLQINEICWQVGFENVNHFIQIFKRETGSTPAMYRKKGY